MGAAAYVAVVLALIERLPALRLRPAPLWRAHALTDVVYLLTGWVAGAALALAYVAAASASLDAWTHLRATLWPQVPFAAQVAVALVALDLGNFGCHVLLHRVDVLWRFHEAHHSSLHLDWLATFRSHLVEQTLRRVLAPALVIALGVPIAAVAAGAVVFYCWAMLNHANLHLPTRALERIFVTPRLHRVHHVPATTERNLGTVFVWWDRLLGTFVTAGPPPTALLGLPQRRLEYPQDWGRQLVAPLRSSDAAWPGLVRG